MSVYPAPPKTFAELIAPFSEGVQNIAGELRGQIMQVLPEVEENIYGGKSVGNALYSLGGASRVVCGIQPASDLCRLYLHNVHDPHGSTLKLEGKGNNARHIKIRSIEEAQSEGVGRLIAQAGKQG